jgi:ATP-dependent DNA helicase HFM1/MER3
MKTRGSGVRFVAVSATVPNIDDVAHWIASRYSNGAAAALQVSWQLYCSRIYIDCPK